MRSENCRALARARPSIRWFGALVPVALLLLLSLWVVGGLRTSVQPFGTLERAARGQAISANSQPGGPREHKSIARPYAGITYVPLGSQTMRQYGLNFEGGALVTAVAASSPAERADIRAGDIVYALNDRLLTPNLSLLDLLWSEQPLAIISLLGWRQGRHYRALVVLEER